MPRKRGQLSGEEKEFILAHADKLTAQQMADKLERTVETIAKFVRKYYMPRKNPEHREQAEKVAIRTELRNSEEWTRLKEEFTGKELKLFEEKFIALMSQFRADVLPSEVTQIMQAIKFEILMSRNLMARQKALLDIERLEKMQESILGQFNSIADMNQDDRSSLMNLESQLQIAKTAEQSRTVEYVKLQERHGKLMENLKATRDQRVDKIESGKVNMLGLLKMMSRKEIQEPEGREMELMRLATMKEYNRLGQLYAYEDGTVDRPILSPDTVELYEEGHEPQPRAATGDTDSGDEVAGDS